MAIECDASRLLAAQQDAHGGVAVVSGFLSETELATMTPFAEGMLDARFGRSAWADSTVDNVTHNDTYSRMLLHWKPRTGTGADGGRRIRLLEALGVRLRRLPGVAAPLPSHLSGLSRPSNTREIESLHLHAYVSNARHIPSGSSYSGLHHSPSEPSAKLGRIFAMHHDRNAGLNRYATAIIFLGNQTRPPSDGGHTIYPLIGDYAGNKEAVKAKKVLRDLVAKSAKERKNDEGLPPRRSSQREEAFREGGGNVD